MANAGGNRRNIRPDFATIGGLILAVAGIMGGLVLEGGKVADVAQFTAALIVLGGTLGAVMVTTPMPVLIRAAKSVSVVFFDSTPDPAETIEKLIAYASKARKSSIVSLETELEKIDDPFLQKALSLAVDGTDLDEIRKMMEIDMLLHERNDEAVAKVYETAGGYAPTIGIIGAVLGLMQVMKHLENIEGVGKGIAVAFVATVYGVASANLFFLPAGSKLKARAEHAMQIRELTLEGICGIVEGLNPKLIRLKLEGFTSRQDRKRAEQRAPAAKRSAQTVGA